MAYTKDCPALRFDVEGFGSKSETEQSDIIRVLAEAKERAAKHAHRFATPWISWAYEDLGDGYFVVFPESKVVAALAFAVDLVCFLAEYNAGHHGRNLRIRVRIAIGYGRMSRESDQEHEKWKGPLRVELERFIEHPRFKEQLKKVDGDHVVTINSRFYAQYLDEKQDPDANFSTTSPEVKRFGLTDDNLSSFTFFHKDGRSYKGFLYGTWLVDDTAGYKDAEAKPKPEILPVNRNSASRFLKALDGSSLTLFFDIRQPMNAEADGVYPGWFSEPMIVHTALQVSAIRMRQHLLHRSEDCPPFAGSPAARIHFVGDTKQSIRENIAANREFNTFIFIHEVMGIPIAIVPLDEFLTIIRDNAEFFGDPDTAAALGLPASLPEDVEVSWPMARGKLKDALRDMSSHRPSDQVWPSIDFAVMGEPRKWREVWGAVFYRDSENGAETHYHQIPESLRTVKGKRVLKLDHGPTVTVNLPPTARNIYINFAQLMFEAIFTRVDDNGHWLHDNRTRDPTARAINAMNSGEAGFWESCAQRYIWPRDDYKFIVE